SKTGEKERSQSNRERPGQRRRERRSRETARKRRREETRETGRKEEMIAQAPSTKPQAPVKLQIPSPKIAAFFVPAQMLSPCGTVSLFGAWDFLGAWDLGFGASMPR